MADAEASMPNVELVSSFAEATTSGEIDRAVALLADDVRWSRPPDAPITGTLEGADQVRKMWRALIDSLESFEVEPTGFEEAGERVLARVTMRGTPKGGGGSFEFSGAQVFRIQEGKIVEVREFRSLPEARAALDS